MCACCILLCYLFNGFVSSLRLSRVILKWMVTIDQPIRSRVFFLLSTSLKLSVGFFGGFYASVYVSLSVEKKKNGGEKDFGFRLPSTEKRK